MSADVKVFHAGEWHLVRHIYDQPTFDRPMFLLGRTYALTEHVDIDEVCSTGMLAGNITPNQALNMIVGWVVESDEPIPTDEQVRAVKAALYDAVVGA